MAMAGRGVRWGASLWGFYGWRPPETWPSLPDAARAILSVDPLLGLEVWASKSLDVEEADAAELVELSDVCRLARFVTVHVRGAYWRWTPLGLRREIEFAARVGAETLVLHPVCLGLSDPDDRIDVPEIRRIGREAAAHGVRLAVENLPDSIATLDRLLEAVGDDPRRTNLWVCIDVGHAHLSHDAGREPVSNYLERYAAQLAHVHLHDNYGETDAHLVPGRGTIDWRRTFDVLDAIGFSGTAVLEVHPGDRSPDEGIRDGLAFLAALP